MSSDQADKEAMRERAIRAIARGFHDFAGGHPDYPNYDEVACGASTEYHCEAGHEHGSRGICWACEPPSAHIVDKILMPLLASAWLNGCGMGEDYGRNVTSGEPSDWPDGLPVNPYGDPARDDHDYWAAVCICGMSEQERTGHYPEHEGWCDVPSPLDDEESR